MRYTGTIFLIFLSSLCANAQELFPLTEPASSIPKGALGVRLFYQTFTADSAGNSGVRRNMLYARLMYGVTSKLSVEVTAAGSNHHDTILPPNLINHRHLANGEPSYFIQPFSRAVPYPFLFAGFDFYAKYRILSFDGNKEHFRLALFGEYSTVKAAHDEAEPDLLDDDGGWEAGFIATKLINRWAISLTAGYINPTFTYTEVQSQYVNPTQITNVSYGRAVEYDLSIGYRFYPAKYTNNYSEPNFNVYVEFLGKTYDSATVKLNGQVLGIKTNLLQSGTYIEIHPGIQWIVNSNTRIELTIGYPLISQSYSIFYPVYTVGVQRYFYFVKSKKADTP